MRMSVRHSRRPPMCHGSRARAVREAAWSQVCDRTFAFMDWPSGIELAPARLPTGGCEKASFDALDGAAAEILEVQSFEEAMSPDELLAWLDASLKGGEH